MCICVYLQLRIMAVDGGTPARSATATVGITVIRNLNSPKFDQSSVRVSIPDNSAPGIAITKVTAKDADRDVSLYFTQQWI